MATACLRWRHFPTPQQAGSNQAVSTTSCAAKCRSTTARTSGRSTVLYQVLGPAGLKDGIADVVSGNNTVTIDGKVFVPGFAAARGFDVASGWGTVRADTFAPALARATQSAHQDTAVRAQAKMALASLEHQEQLSRPSVSQGGTTLLTAQGFLPGHPVSLYIDGRKIAGFYADGHGSISYLIKPSALGLRPGRHVVDLVSMLITTTNVFHSQ